MLSICLPKFALGRSDPSSTTTPPARRPLPRPFVRSFARHLLASKSTRLDSITMPPLRPTTAYTHIYITYIHTYQPTVNQARAHLMPVSLPPSLTLTPSLSILNSHYIHPFVTTIHHHYTYTALFLSVSLSVYFLSSIQTHYSTAAPPHHHPLFVHTYHICAHYHYPLPILPAYLRTPILRIYEPALALSRLFCVIIPTRSSIYLSAFSLFFPLLNEMNE
ncbi:hypothetical protein C8J57DRAFT_736078 [Mycena rebaudengoi]|nr:hypothetical protein C8J57DRAFT_736078 [Mycena rebaudengoi]